MTLSLISPNRHLTTRGGAAQSAMASTDVAATADRFEARANWQDRAATLIPGVKSFATPIISAATWTVGVATGLLTHSLVSGAVGFLGAGTFLVGGVVLAALTRSALQASAGSNHGRAIMTRGTVPDFELTEMRTEDGSRLRIGMGTGSQRDHLHVQYIEKGSDHPSVELYTTGGHRISDGLLAADARTLDGHKYHVFAQYPTSEGHTISGAGPTTSFLLGRGVLARFDAAG